MDWQRDCPLQAMPRNNAITMIQTRDYISSYLQKKKNLAGEVYKNPLMMHHPEKQLPHPDKTFKMPY
jgi:hypothetical protein